MPVQSRDEWRENVQRHMDADTCYLCEQPVLPFTPVHGLTGAHWDCCEKLHLVATATVAPPKATGVLRKLRPKGGHLVHLVDTGTNEAICGYKQANTATRMRKRSGWYLVTDSYPAELRDCQKCLEKDEL